MSRCAVGRSLASRIRIVQVMNHQDLQVVGKLIFLDGLAEEEHLVVVLPFGHVRFVRDSVRQHRLVFPVKNGPEVLEFGFYVVHCKKIGNTKS